MTQQFLPNYQDKDFTQLIITLAFNLFYVINSLYLFLFLSLSHTHTLVDRQAEKHIRQTD